MPGPSSSTSSTAGATTRKITLPPAGVCARALSTRLLNSSLSSVGSPLSHTGASASRASATPRLCAKGAMAMPSSRASWLRSRRCAPPSAIARAPFSTRASDNNWLARWVSLSVPWAADSKVCRHSCGSEERNPSSTRAFKAASGVRSSWAASAMNCAWRSNWPRKRSVKWFKARTSGLSSRCTCTTGSARRSSGWRSSTAVRRRSSGRNAALTANHTITSAPSASMPRRSRVSAINPRAMRTRASSVSATRISAMPFMFGSLTAFSRLTTRTSWPR
ncbi:hypothetical protein D3C81_1471730 [compost metagenome]